MGEFWFGTDIMSQFNPWGNVIRMWLQQRMFTDADRAGGVIHGLDTLAGIPYALKPVGDEAFVAGLNRMVFHQYTHQPLLDMKPGWQYGAGTHFDRNITWWEQARAFFQYLARCQYLLQSGSLSRMPLFLRRGRNQVCALERVCASVSSARL